MSAPVMRCRSSLGRRGGEHRGPWRLPCACVGEAAHDELAVSRERHADISEVPGEGVPGGAGRQRDINCQPGSQVSVNGLGEQRGLGVARAEGGVAPMPGLP